jgi:hypothetical protein
LAEHWGKLKKISKYSDIELQQVFSSIISRIRFINVELTPEKLLIKGLRKKIGTIRFQLMNYIGL